MGDEERGLGRDEPLLQKREIQNRSDEDGEDGTTFWFACFNLFNQIEGLGLLAVPYAFRVGGWYTIPLLLIVAFASCVSGRLLSHCLRDALGNKIRSTYHECGSDSYGPAFKRFIVAIQLIGLAGVAITFVILIANALTSLFPISQHIASLLATIACMPLLLFNKLNYVAYLSILSVSVLLIVCVCVPESSVERILDGDAPRIESLEVPSIDTMEGFGLLIFALSAHSTFPQHEASMAKPEDFPKALTVTYVALTLVKLSFGGVAWMAFGDATDEIITENLSKTTQKIVSAAIGLNTWLTLPLVVVVFFRITSGVLQRVDVSWSRQLAERVIALSMCGVCAALLPHFALLVSIFGALSGTLLTFIFPAVMYMKLHGARAGLAANVGAVLLCLFGVVGGSLGLVLSIKRLVSSV